jgi:hypothetical protein
MAPKVVLGIPDPPLATPALEDRDLCYSYAIARGEMGVLTFEPYKSLILPFWAFRTASIARTSAEVLWAIFVSCCERGDFVVNSDPKIHINNVTERANGWKGSRHDSEVHPNGSNEIETVCESQRYVLCLVLRMSRGVHRSSQEGASTAQMARFSSNGLGWMLMARSARRTKRARSSKSTGGDAQAIRRI